MGKKIDLVGQRFSMLLVVDRAETDGVDRHSRWICQCDCGNTTAVRSNYLLSGHTTSCGCYKATKKRKHGQSKTRLYTIYYKILSRCYDVNNDQYKDYGGRGICVCEDWRNDFQSFFDWATANGYSDDLTIDRVNVNGDYTPNNCRWATRKTQANNTRRNALYTYNGKTKTIAEWSAETGVNYNTLRARLRRYGWDIEKAITGDKRNEI